MATQRLTHVQREESVLTDLETNFPKFAGREASWTGVAEGKDPPDFLSHGSRPIGLELVEWLDGDQMTAAKTRESLRNQIIHLLGNNWENEHRPQNFRFVFIEAKNERTASSDAYDLRREFFACAAAVDATWLTNTERLGGSYYQTEFLGYPRLEKYFVSIRYLDGEPLASQWFYVRGDHGAIDRAQPVETLRQALEAKLANYLNPEKQTLLRAHGLSELCLLVHGGFNAFAYNTPWGLSSLEHIARLGATFYATHAQRHIFSRVWFFNSLDTEDELSQAMGFPPGYGRVRWLAQLWPEFRVYPGSSTSCRQA